MLKRLSPYWLWALLTILPALWVYNALTSTNSRIIHILVHPSGEFAARVLIITLMMTPLALLFSGKPFARWLRKNRRYFGVAAFAYAALHTYFYYIDKGSVERMIDELPRLYIWTGWIALIIFIPLAITSWDYFVRRMGPAWKWLQRGVYLAAILTLIHWASLHNWDHPSIAYIHFAPLVLLEIYRIAHWMRRRKNRVLQKV